MLSPYRCGRSSCTVLLFLRPVSWVVVSPLGSWVYKSQAYVAVGFWFCCLSVTTSYAGIFFGPLLYVFSHHSSAKAPSRPSPGNRKVRSSFEKRGEKGLPVKNVGIAQPETLQWCQNFCNSASLRIMGLSHILHRAISVPSFVL